MRHRMMSSFLLYVAATPSGSLPNLLFAHVLNAYCSRCDTNPMCCSVFEKGMHEQLHIFNMIFCTLISLYFLLNIVKWKHQQHFSNMIFSVKAN